MRQSRFTEARIIAILREQEAGSKTGDVCRKNGVGPPALFFALAFSCESILASRGDDKSRALGIVKCRAVGLCKRRAETDFVSGNGIAKASQRYYKVNVSLIALTWSWTSRPMTLLVVRFIQIAG
jgi:Transposase